MADPLARAHSNEPSEHLREGPEGLSDLRGLFSYNLSPVE